MKIQRSRWNRWPVPVHFPLNVVNQKRTSFSEKKKITMSRNFFQTTAQKKVWVLPHSPYGFGKKKQNIQRLHRSLALSRPWPSQTSWRNSPANYATGWWYGSKEWWGDKQSSINMELPSYNLKKKKNKSMIMMVMIINIIMIMVNMMIMKLMNLMNMMNIDIWWE